MGVFLSIYIPNKREYWKEFQSESRHISEIHPKIHLNHKPLKKSNPKLTRQRHQHQKTVFCNINSINALAHILKTEKRKMLMMAKKTRYRTFSTPKKGGGERLIETPFAELKRLQSNLSKFLQSVYYFEKSSAAYGFIVGVRNEEDRRNVMTNAKKHVNRPYMVNIDLKDFFHAVSRKRVVEMFSKPPFNFRRELPEMLANLTTFEDRLPMGTPTSPVLSNFACRDLDRELIIFAERMGLTYTRYADDMTFSSNQKMEAQAFNVLKGIIEKYDFKINERKLKFYGPNDAKIITGLIVTDKVALEPNYLPKIKTEIDRLRSIMHSQNEQGQFSTKWVEQFKRQIRGRLNFAGFVLNRRDENYIALKDAYYEAIHPPEEEFGAINWRSFPYNI